MAKLEVQLAESTDKTWCQRHNKIRCLGMCGLFTLIFLIIMAIVFWPRITFICVDYASASVTLPAIPITTPTPEIGISIPITVDNGNLWGMTIRNIEVEGYYKGNEETTMTTGTIDNFSLTPSGFTMFPVTMKTPGLSVAQYKTVLKYLNDDCGADPIAAATKKWPLDMKIKVNFMGIKFDFWIRDIQIPCATAAAGAGVVTTSKDNKDKNCADKNKNNKTPATSHNCIALFCSVTDLMCKGEPCMKERDPKASKSTGGGKATGGDTPAAAACAAGTTWSAAGTAPCALCAADATCPNGVKTACTVTANTVCTAAPAATPCAAGTTWSAAGTTPCAPCAADATCPNGVETACTVTANTVCKAAPAATPCAAGTTWSAAGTTPCAACAADALCLTGVKTACTATANTVCN